MAEPEDADPDGVAPPGSLVLVATPIGNLADISTRAVAALRTADVIACEDTRRTGRLLHHLGISGARLLRLDQHRERAGVADVIAELAKGGRVVLVSDAGTPAVSDPGERLVRAVLDAGRRVVSVPGPSALLAALVVSGLPTERFAFEGFLPRKGSDRIERLRSIGDDPRTTVVFENPKRLPQTLRDLVEHCGTVRRVAICRELTKLHEEVWRGGLGDALDASIDERGEAVLVIEGRAPLEPVGDDVVRAALTEVLSGGGSRRDAVTQVARRLGVARNAVYDLALTLSDTDDAAP